MILVNFLKIQSSDKAEYVSSKTVEYKEIYKSKAWLIKASTCKSQYL